MGHHLHAPERLVHLRRRTRSRIAMHRALAAWAATQTFPVRWLFIATSGHEWVDAGAEIFHHTQAPGPDNTVLWYHLGASFGARAYEETADGLVPLDTPNLARTLMATKDLVPIAKQPSPDRR